MSERDYYEVLGVGKNATEDEIKRAYRKQAKAFHPDRNKGDKDAEQKFKEVQAAYDVLKDPQKRSVYDRFGHAGFGSGTHAGEWRTAPGGQRVYTSPGGSFDVGDIEDLLRGFGGGFADIFGGRGGGRGRRPAPTAEPAADLNIQTDVNIAFEQAIYGTNIELKLSSPDGHQQTLEVKIPSAVEDGQTIRVKGKGPTGPDGRRGDVLIRVRVGKHRYFRREGYDIFLDVPITITEATLGARVDVPTLDGQTTVTITPGTSGGSKLRLKGKGLLNPASKEQGHQFLLIRIVVPPELTAEQKQLLEELRESIDQDPRKTLNW